MNDERNQDDSVLKQQECSWCWEEIAVLMCDGEAFCEDCDHEIRELKQDVATLTEDARQALEPTLKAWVDKHEEKDADLLEDVLISLVKRVSKSDTGVTL